MENNVLNQINVTDEAITILALRNLINNRKADAIHIVQEGESNTTLKAILNQTSFSQMLNIEEILEVHVTVNMEKLSAAMKKIKILTTEQDYFEWAIAKGASNSLLSLLFPSLADNAAIAQLRKVLIPENTGFVRKTIIKDQAVKEQIHQKWHVLNQSLEINLFEKLHALHEHFQNQHDLNMLVKVLKEYEDWGI